MITFIPISTGIILDYPGGIILPPVIIVIIIREKNINKRILKIFLAD